MVNFEDTGDNNMEELVEQSLSGATTEDKGQWVCRM